MSKPTLGRLLNRRQIQTFLQDWGNLADSPVTLGILDLSGQWIAVYPPETEIPLLEKEWPSTETVADERQAILPLMDNDSQVLGAFYISPNFPALRSAVHSILTLLVQKESMLKSLAQETLERYREVNLLYRVHETIGTSVDLQEVIRRVLDESVRILKADGGAVLLPDDLTDTLIVSSQMGLDDPFGQDALFKYALPRQVFESGRAQILNELNICDSEFSETIPFSAILTAPLKAQDVVQGVIILFRGGTGGMFTAGDEKLLGAIASQAGIAIANAKQVQEREQRFKQQIQALRIEIDEAKKQREVAHITESEYFRYLQENAQRMREEFDI